MAYPNQRPRIWTGALFASWALLLAPLACEQDPPQASPLPDSTCVTSKDCLAGEFCNEDSACEAECKSCGRTCERTGDCPLGQFCDTGMGLCQQECSPDSGNECGAQRKCSADGKCIADSDIDIPDSMGGAGGGDGDDGNDECIDVQVEFTPEIPSVVLLIDQSASMTEDDFTDAVDAAEAAGTYERWDCPDSPNGGSATDGWDDDEEIDYAWRWNVVRNVLLHPERGIVKPLESKVRFGLALYSSLRGDLGETCPMLTEVDVAFDNHQRMLDSFLCSDLLKDTPTRESLTAVAEKLAQEDGPKIIVLATDGAPDTCQCGDWDTRDGRPAACDNRDEDNLVEFEGEFYPPSDYEQVLTTLEAKRIHDELGITVEVINLGAPELKPHLDSVAAHGGALGGVSIDGTSPTGLIEAFETIIDGARSCVIDLDGAITSGKESTGTVLLDMDPTANTDFQEIELDDENGWVVNTPTQIELVGEACDTIKQGDHELDISFPCDSFVVVPR